MCYLFVIITSHKWISIYCTMLFGNHDIVRGFWALLERLHFALDPFSALHSFSLPYCPFTMSSIAAFLPILEQWFSKWSSDQQASASVRWAEMQIEGIHPTLESEALQLIEAKFHKRCYCSQAVNNHNPV